MSTQVTPRGIANPNFIKFSNAPKFSSESGRELQQKLDFAAHSNGSSRMSRHRELAAHAKWDDEVTRILQDLKEQQLVIDRVAFGQSSTTPSFLKITDDTATIATMT